MELIIKPRRISDQVKDDIRQYIFYRDFYNLNKSFWSEYTIKLKNFSELSDEDGIFIILSSLLICIKRLNNKEDVALQLSDSPPTIIFRYNHEKINIQLDSYGDIIYEELMDCDKLIQLLKETISTCRSFISATVNLKPADFDSLLDDLNPNYLGLSSFIEQS